MEMLGLFIWILLGLNGVVFMLNLYQFINVDRKVNKIKKENPSNITQQYIQYLDLGWLIPINLGVALMNVFVMFRILLGS